MMLTKRRKEMTMTITATKKKSKPAGPAVKSASPEGRKLAAAIMGC